MTTPSYPNLDVTQNPKCNVVTVVGYELIPRAAPGWPAEHAGGSGTVRYRPGTPVPSGMGFPKAHSQLKTAHSQLICSRTPPSHHVVVWYSAAFRLRPLGLILSPEFTCFTAVPRLFHGCFTALHSSFTAHHRYRPVPSGTVRELRYRPGWSGMVRDGELVGRMGPYPTAVTTL